MKGDFVVAQDKSFIHNFTLLLLYSGICVILVSIAILFCCYLHPITSKKGVLFENPIDSIVLKFNSFTIDLNKNEEKNATYYTGSYNYQIIGSNELWLSSYGENVSANTIKVLSNYTQKVDFKAESEDDCFFHCPEYEYDTSCICKYDYYPSEICIKIKQVSSQKMAFVEGCYKFNDFDLFESYVKLTNRGSDLKITLIESRNEIEIAGAKLDRLFLRLSKYASIMLFISSLIFLASNIMLWYVIYGSEKEDKFHHIVEEIPERSSSENGIQSYNPANKI